MQTSELEQSKNDLLGDKECINFRPSPNFKHMKKYLKSKSEEVNSPNQSSDQSTTPNSEDHESVKPLQATSSSMAQQVQPPLPPNSPPPELLVVPKQEVEDEEYDDSLVTQGQDNEEASEMQPKKTMCRQFARGKCARGAFCIYLHELIVSQLPGVYTFCNNFQNSLCNLPKCKFVHATVFEKERFYRTGYLPSHTLYHLKESNSALVPTALEGNPAEAPQMLSNPPSARLAAVSAVPTSGCAPSERAESLAPAKRDWSELELAMAAHEHDNSEPMLKKCKSCDVNELRLQRAKTKVETLKKEAEKYAKQKQQLMKKDARLNNVIDGMLNPPMIDQLSMYLKVNSCMNEMGATQKLLLIKILNNLKENSSDPRPHSSPIGQ